MAVAPAPADIYGRAVEEGRRRLDASPLELMATGFNAGFTIVLGIAALGLVHALVEPRFGPEIAKLAGAGGFAMGLVFLVVSRSELFTENFFDPVAAVFEDARGQMLLRLARLWGVVLVLNLLGGGILIAILSVDDVMPPGAEQALSKVADEIAAKGVGAGFANALVGGALVTLLSFLLQAVDSVLARMAAAFLVGFVLAAGPFAHVVVTFQHLLFGLFADAAVAWGDVVGATALAVVGNLVGGLAFVTLTHIAQARSGSS